MQGINKMLPPVPTQWGAPLTGVQMQRLQDAGLRACGFKMTGESQVDDKGVVTKTYDKYHLPADHPAYTLLEAGWLDGRNVALWFGGEKAPDDAVQYLTASGVSYEAHGARWEWIHGGKFDDIIAYTRKAEIVHPPANEKLKDAVRLWREMTAQPETVTIAKMTEAEAMKRLEANCFDEMALLRQLGLIKPEQTRLERFWSTRDTKDVYGPPCKAFQLIEEALNFERD